MPAVQYSVYHVFVFCIQENVLPTVEKPVGSTPVASVRSTPVTPVHSTPVTPVDTKWQDSFVIPAAFSVFTEKAIKSGILTKRVRTEIVQSLSTSILIHTRNPSGDQYNAVCLKLIETYPTLKDLHGNM